MRHIAGSRIKVVAVAVVVLSVLFTCLMLLHSEATELVEARVQTVGMMNVAAKTHPHPRIRNGIFAKFGRTLEQMSAELKALSGIPALRDRHARPRHVIASPKALQNAADPAREAQRALAHSLEFHGHSDLHRSSAITSIVLIASHA